MATGEQLSVEIVNQGLKDSGPYAGSLNLSVRVRRGLSKFTTSVNLKYVKLGYVYLLSHAFRFLSASIFLIGSAGIGKLTWQDISFKSNVVDALFVVAFLVLILYIFLDLTPPSTYLVDFACYCPPDELKISKEEFVQLAKNSGSFDTAAIDFQLGVLQNSGIGDESYMPRVVFRPGYRITLQDGREEAAMAMFGAVDNLFAATKIRPKDIRILVVNCGILNTTPSLSAMVINHYKLSHNVNSFNLGGMGCSAGIIAIDVARDLLNAYPGSYALVVSTEAVSRTWYGGNQIDMLLPNCFFRMGASACLLSSCLLDRWRAKYELKQLVRTHMGRDNRSFRSIHLKEDKEGNKGLHMSKDIIEVGGNALDTNISTLVPLVLPVSEQVHFFKILLSSKNQDRPYIADYKLDFDHVCVLATSKKVLDEIQKRLKLTEKNMEASRKTLERFGNTSSSSIWYELAYLEANNKMKRGDRVCQIAFGSGFKCNSVVWKALRNVRCPNQSPWVKN